jgi:aspartyl-tRNA(Asn)/glutamyl-tRNA(Gln) amidotransferase subunit A
VEDVALTLSVLAGYDAADPASTDVPVPDYLAGLRDRGRSPRLALPHRLVERAEPETMAHVHAVADQCRRAGAAVVDVDLPSTFAGLSEAGQRVMQAEAAAFHAPRFPAHADRYQEKFRATLAAGASIAARDYVPALRHCRQFRRDLEPLLARFDAILTPVAPGPAPRGSSRPATRRSAPPGAMRACRRSRCRRASPRTACRSASSSPRLRGARRICSRRPGGWRNAWRSAASRR